jgi:oligosaccharyltransferase complex subunit alpha (ribophorin I)
MAEQAGVRKLEASCLSPKHMLASPRSPLREPHIRPAGKMRLIHAAVAGFFVLATAKANLTHGSKNVLPSTFQPPQHFRNTNLVRNINLEKSYPRETINVVVENVDKQPQSEYYLPFEQHVISRIGGLEAKDKKDATKAPFNVEIVALDEGR